MRKALRLVLDVILFVWQIPQHILGIILLGVFTALGKVAKRTMSVDLFGRFKVKTALFELKDSDFGVSLGMIIILDPEHYGEQTRRHEVGHSVQSLMLGPLYLLTVGLISISQNLLSRIKPDGAYARAYYERWPEKWADQLMRIER